MFFGILKFFDLSPMNMKRLVNLLLTLIICVLPIVSQTITPSTSIIKDLTSFTFNYNDSVYLRKPLVSELYKVNIDGSIGEKISELHSISGSVAYGSICFRTDLPPETPGLYALKIPEISILRYKSLSDKDNDHFPEWGSLDPDNIDVNKDSIIDYDQPTFLNIQSPKLRVLDIGNSYSKNATSYLPELFDNLDLDKSKVSLYRALRTGGSFKNWYDIYNDKDTSNYYIQHVLGDLRCENLNIKNAFKGSQGIKELLNNYQWDLIIIHQASQFAPFYENWTSDSEAGCLSELVNLIRECQPEAKIGTLLVHSYGTDSYYNKLHLSTVERWSNIAYSVSKMREDFDIDLIIPYGTAIENVRATSLNNNADLLEDGSHLSAGLACYTASCCYYESVFSRWFKQSMIGNTLRPVGEPSVTDDNASISQKAALHACLNPYSLDSGAFIERTSANTFFFAFIPEEKINTIEVTINRAGDSIVVFTTQPEKELEIDYDLDEYWEMEDIYLVPTHSSSPSWSTNSFRNTELLPPKVQLSHSDGKILIPADILKEDVTLNINVKYNKEIQVTMNVESGIVSIYDICLSLYNDKVSINGLNPGDKICIYSPAGHILKKYTSQSSEINILLDRGIYIIRINDIAAKVVNIP